jgi:hypothetical protein
MDRERELKEDEALLKSFNDSGVKFFRHPDIEGERQSTHAILRYLLTEVSRKSTHETLITPPHLIAYVDPSLTSKSVL